MISSEPITLSRKETAAPAEAPKETGPKVIRIDIGPAKEKPAETPPPDGLGVVTEGKPLQVADLPPETVEETNLTDRLKEKMLDAYGGKAEDVPDVKIYLSEMKYDDFVKYYENLGYKVNSVAVPASEIIGPVLEQRPELAEKINLAKYQDVVIHQVMVDDAGISAADKYIDPDTFEIVEKTFVTKMNK